MPSAMDFSANSDLLAEVLINPRAAAQKAGLDENDPTHHEQIRQLELFARVAHASLKAAGDIAEIQTPQLAWGIGAGCCSTKAFMAVKTP